VGLPVVTGTARVGPPVVTGTAQASANRREETTVDVTRREFLRIGGATVAAVAAVPLRGDLPPRPGVHWVARTAADMPAPDLPALLLSRAAFGARPGDVEAVRQTGSDAWIEAQLDHATIDDSAVEAALRKALPSLSMTPAQLFTAYDKKEGELIAELRVATLYRMAFSPRLLYEVMVEFWSDHFNIYHVSNLCRTFKTIDDRDVIRKHALGKFKDLLTASATSPAMLHYLDNDVNRRGRVNENYAREIMELHTLGVSKDGYPYTEEDVKNVALCLTGWGWERQQGSATYGEFLYRDADHDQGPKNVLGHRIPAAQRDRDGRDVIDILCAHEATPRFLATKLVRRFVTDDPGGQTPDLVTRVADAYVRTDGDIAEMLSTVLRSREFAQSFGQYGGRLSRPLDHIARLLRAADVRPEHVQLATPSANALFQRLNFALASMGQLPFYWITPDGYPDVKEAWAGNSTTLLRWNLGLALTGGALVDGFVPPSQTPSDIATAGAFVDFWIDRLLHRPMATEDRNTVIHYLTEGKGESLPMDRIRLTARITLTLALILDSPYFVWR
jgi:uncharacterized protein (DUF1800 family)